MSSTLDPRTTPEPPADPPAQGAAEDVPEDVAGARAEDPGDRRRRGLKKSAADMVRSMLVVVGIVAVIVLVVPRPSQTPQRDIDVAAVARGAATKLSFTPAVPVVPSGWVPTSAEVRNSADGITTWHIGYLTADGHYAGVEQAATVTARWVEILGSGGTPREARTVDGTTWEQLYKDVRSVHTLIHRGDGRTTLITSKDGGLENAEVLARSIPVAQR